jgi:speckle-type POZ protein
MYYDSVLRYRSCIAMASATAATAAGTAKMIVHYEWILGNVDGEPKTYASKMILFRGEKMFRVGLKNNVEGPVLFFMAIDLNKMGMKVERVMCSEVPTMMLEMEKQNIGDEGSLQLFTIEFKSKFTAGTYGTFLFHIQMEGSVPEFSYQLSDRLAKNQLWDSATVNSQRSAVDVELNVRDRTFSAHKAILAARSPVFANEFAKKQSLTNGPQKIQIDGVEPSTVEQFLYFIYTGESVSSLANEELLKLAVKYQIKTLASLCKTALNKIETTQMVNLTSSLHVNPEIHTSITR